MNKVNSAEELSLRHVWNLLLDLPIGKQIGVIAAIVGLLLSCYVWGFDAKADYYRGLQDKERFVSLYLDYWIAKYHYANESSEGNLSKLNAAAFGVEEYLRELDRLSRVGSVEFERIRVGKGGEGVVITFLFDGSKRTIPETPSYASSNETGENPIRVKH